MLLVFKQHFETEEVILKQSKLQGLYLYSNNSSNCSLIVFFSIERQTI